MAVVLSDNGVIVGELQFENLCLSSVQNLETVC